MNQQSTFYPSRLFLVCLILTAAIAIIVLSGQITFAQRPVLLSRPAKVDPQVWSDLQAQGEATVFVVMRKQAEVSAAYTVRDRVARLQYVYETLKETAQRTQSPLLTILKAQGVPYRSFFIRNMVLLHGDAALLAQLAARQDVAAIEPNTRYHRLLPPPDISAAAVRSPGGIEWGLQYINANDVWNRYGVRGAEIVVASADTGVMYNHPALVNQYRGNLGEGNFDHNYNWHDGTCVTSSFDPPGSGECSEPKDVPHDGEGHGTHTVGTMVGDDGGSNHIGVAPGAQWIACRNMNDSGWGAKAFYADCFEWFLAPTDLNGANPDPNKAPHVINNSWGCPTTAGGEDCDDPTNDLVVETENLRAAGIMVVASAGNSGPGCSSISDPPAIYDAAFTVAAHNSSGDIASFSSRGPALHTNLFKPDVAAPGVNVRSAVVGGGYASYSGTSMAGPHVAGLVALLWSADPFLIGQIDETEELIRQTAVHRTTTDGCGGDTPTSMPNHTWGWGIVDALAAVAARLDGTLTGQVDGAEGKTSLSDAWVEATRADGIHKATTTDASGRYTQTLPAGTYTVTARAYGYLPAQATDVQVISRSETTQNFLLSPAPTWTVSGVVTSTATGLPLTATVAFLGSPVITTTNPADGYYAALIAQGTYTMQVNADGYTPAQRLVYVNDNRTENFTLLPRPPLLVVDDDLGDPGQLETYYITALDALGERYDLWQVSVQGVPSADTLRQYCAVIWLTGQDYRLTLTAEEQTALSTWLDTPGKGKLFISGQDIGYDIGDEPFYGTYLHASYLADDAGDYSLAGADFMTGLEVSLAGGDGAASHPGYTLYPSEIEPLAGAMPICLYSPGKEGAVAYDGDHQVVYLAFGFEAINATADRKAVMGRVLDWLGCGAHACPADADRTGQVDITDLQILAAHWGAASGDPAYRLRYDLNGDGKITALDLQQAAQSWGQRCDGLR